MTIQGDLESVVRAHIGQDWTVLNEPELLVGLDQYSALWNQAFLRIKSADPTAKVFFPGMAANNPTYQTFLPEVMSKSFKPDYFTFHVYPGVDNRGTCENQSTYNLGLTNSKSLVQQFMLVVSQYHLPVRLTEWGWIRNAPVNSVGEFTGPEQNTACVAKYITDFADYLRATTIEKFLYFPNGLSVREQPWCDHNYAPGFSLDWPCWSGGLNTPNTIAAWNSAIVLCTPRPRPRLSVSLAGDGSVLVGVDDPVGVDSIEITVANNGRVLNLTKSGFTAARITPGPVTVSFIIHDRCGPWNTFAGAGQLHSAVK